jgi:hypothetical protein
MVVDEKTQKDLHLIYTASIEDIKFAKRQQWQLTYYALISMGALMYLKTRYHLPFCWGDALINVLIIIIAIFAIFLLWKMENDIRRYRGRIRQARILLSDQFKNIIELDANYLKASYKIGYLLIMSTTLAVAAFLLALVPPSIHTSF